MLFKLLGVCLFLTLASADKIKSIGVAPFVVNGTDANILEVPFIASLQYFNAKGESKHSCGSSILSTYWVLTAAHCIYRENPLEYIIEYGTTEISDGPNGTRIAFASEFIAHEDYNDYTIENDIGLVRLSTPVVWNMEFRVKLPIQGQYFQTGTPAVLAGWGRIGTGLPISTILQRINVEVVSSHDCKNIYSEEDIFRTNICAKVPGKGSGSCNGDSGGPMTVNGVLVGLVSWAAKPCGVLPYAGVFTAISPYIEWIEKNSGLDLKLNYFVQSRD